MKPLRTIAVAVTGAVVLAGQAVAATACPQHDSAAALTGPARMGTIKIVRRATSHTSMGER